MPLYAYLCNECGAELEEIRQADERDRPVTCPCGGSTGRIITAGFQIRSTGPSSTSVGTQAGEHVYAPEHRCPIPSYARHLTADQYEQKCEKSFRRAAEKAQKMVRDGAMDSDSDHVGRIPAAEFFARWRQRGKAGAMDIEYWKKTGRVFDHGKKRIKRQG